MGQDFQSAYTHGELTEIFDNVFFVTGSMKMKPPPPMMRFSRNMTVLREGTELTIINSVRLNDQGLEALDALGKVKHIVRLAGLHGSDDPFYKHRYGATVWTLPNQPYVKGFAVKVPPGQQYFQCDMTIEPTTELPIADAMVHCIEGCSPGEGLLVLAREGGILVAGDSLQNWAGADRYFSFAAKLFMKQMGFLKEYNLGPGWLKVAKPSREALQRILDLRFEHVLPAHGKPVIGGAKERFRPVIEAYRA